MFLYQNSKHYKSLNLNVKDENGKQLPIYEWTDLVLRNLGNSNYIEFFNKVVTITYNLIHGTPPPRMFPKNKNILHMSSIVMVGDLYLYEDHIVIRVYGFQDDPYNIHAFLTPKIIVIEYTRHSLISNQEHFLHFKHQRSFFVT